MLYKQGIYSIYSGRAERSAPGTGVLIRLVWRHMELSLDPSSFEAFLMTNAHSKSAQQDRLAPVNDRIYSLSLDPLKISSSFCFSLWLLSLKPVIAAS